MRVWDTLDIHQDRITLARRPRATDFAPIAETRRCRWIASFLGSLLELGEVQAGRPKAPELDGERSAFRASFFVLYLTDSACAVEMGCG